MTTDFNETEALLRIQTQKHEIVTWVDRHGRRQRERFAASESQKMQARIQEIEGAGYSTTIESE
jgi:DNA-binding response OmpR family regulator